MELESLLVVWVSILFGMSVGILFMVLVAPYGARYWKLKYKRELEKQQEKQYAHQHAMKTYLSKVDTYFMFWAQMEESEFTEYRLQLRDGRCCGVIGDGVNEVDLDTDVLEIDPYTALTKAIMELKSLRGEFL